AMPIMSSSPPSRRLSRLQIEVAELWISLVQSAPNRRLLQGLENKALSPLAQDVHEWGDAGAALEEERYASADNNHGGSRTFIAEYGRCAGFSRQGAIEVQTWPCLYV
ncbi:MAG: hypothetical protein ACQETD_02865, partial [Pseudomonadota bacterium]